MDQLIDVAVPDVPRRELTGEHRLQNLPAFAADVGLMMEFAGLPLSKTQIAVMAIAMESLLFGEQAP